MQVPKFKIVPLGTLGGKKSTASSVNDAGQVAGYSDLASGRSHAFLWTEHRMQDIGPDSSTGSTARAINAEGAVAGYVFSQKESGPAQAFLFRGGKMEILPGLGRKNLAEATGINRSGQISGSSGNSLNGLDSRAVLWTDYGSKIHDLGALPGGKSSIAEALNDGGDVVGASDVRGRGTVHGFLHTGGKMLDLGTLGGNYSLASGVNNKRQVVGASTLPSDRSRAFLWERGRMIDLGLLEDDRAEYESLASGINDAGWVVGRTGKFWDGPTRAVLWHDGKVYDLNKLIPPNSGWSLTLAMDISNRGNIAGQGVYQGQTKAFLLQPV